MIGSVAGHEVIKGTLDQVFGHSRTCVLDLNLKRWVVVLFDLFDCNIHPTSFGEFHRVANKVNHDVL